MAQATKKRAAAARRKKAPAARKGSATSKGSSRVSSRRATASRRNAAGGTRQGASRAQTKASATATLANTAALGQMSRLLQEVGGICCVFAALMVLLALISFDINDPGWSHTGAGQAIQNSVGRVGAWFADVTFYLFGFMAYLIPLVLAVCGWLLFRDHGRASSAYRPFVFVRVIGVALMLISASGLADLHFGVPEGALPRGTFGGGILGTAVAWRLVGFLQHLGTTLVLLAVFFSSLTLAFGTSWIQLVETIGGAVVGVAEKLKGAVFSVSESRAEIAKVRAADRAREARLKQTKSSVESRRPWPSLFGRKQAVPELDPLLDIDAENPPRTGLAAALELAREKARKGGQAATAAARHLGDGGRIDSDRLDDMGDSLDRADALLTDVPDTVSRVDAATAAAINDIDAMDDIDLVAPVDKPKPASKIATTPRQDTVIPAMDHNDRKKKISINQRAPEQKQAKLFLDVPDSDLPPLSLLDAPEPQRAGFSDSDLEALSRLLEEKLAEFRITVEVVAVHPGPVITRFEMQLAPGIKASRVTGLSQDIARSMSLVSVRVVEVIAGKSTIGIEVPNDHREIVQLTEMLQSTQYIEKQSPLTLALGKDISGQSVTADLGRMPHLLVAGTTGSGKSVAVNSMLISLLYKATAKDVRLILIDPKNARTQCLRRHTSPAGASGHRYERGGQCVALVCGRNGATLHTDGGTQGSQYRRL